MKKMLLFAAAALSMISMAACSGNKCAKDGKCADRPDETYTGILPAADAEGIRYTLKLDYEDDDNNKSGDYDLSESYVVADSTATTGFRDSKTYLSEGDFTVVEKDGKTYLKLVKDAKDSNANASASLAFEVTSDSTLLMVNDQTFEAPADSTALNYTLRLVSK